MTAGMLRKKKKNTLILVNTRDKFKALVSVMYRIWASVYS